MTLKKADCTSCHTGANFTNEQFHNIGVGWNAEKNDFADYGRFVISPIGSKNNSELRRVQDPDDSGHREYRPLHARRQYDDPRRSGRALQQGGNPNPSLDKDIKKLNLTDSEKADVVAFMKSLTGEPIKVELPTLPPGADGKTPDVKASLGSPAKTAVTSVYHPAGK